MRLAIVTGLFAAINFCCPAQARNEPEHPPMPLGYEDAGPEPVDLLAKIAFALKATLKDPYSIRDMTLCAPVRINPYYATDWVRSYWDVKITLNSKNGFGAYSGSAVYDVKFENGEITKITQFTGITVISAEDNAKLVAFARSCPRVPDAEIQKLMAQ